MRTQRHAYEAATGAPLDAERRGPLGCRRSRRSTAARRLLRLGADAVDTGATVQVETLFDVTVPEPGASDHGLLAADGRGVLYRSAIDLVVVDKAGRYWLVEHRLCEDGFAEIRRPPPRRRRPDPVVGLGTGLPGQSPARSTTSSACRGPTSRSPGT